MKECELCGVRARVHCEADQARLCWDCDGKIHGANFLVAKHPRSLLCHGCQSLTPWTGSGSKLTPTVSVCETCVERRGSKFERRAEVQESEAENDGDDDDEEREVEDGDDDCDESDDDANQVVPWSCCSYTAAEPPPVAGCSSSKEEEEEYSVSKRMRGNADEASDLRCETPLPCSLRMLKRQRLSE
ncbi:hypothetical protein ACFX2I_007509 [Malus domestica]|uniref:COL domain class transcription factor n=1 Tax=Malus domestica TaxID=3750 RepID=D9ZIW2_MALDO|nr:zinc finger protein CONSTANS-LIKE 2 [Malus domestica]XP_050110826.1 zinc finger protein CONSTANS-LIKE 2-like [Malus sylvestris]ADL36665.1 COL domain class transcription factor [Malus domestica]RXH83034.1 hypothetical protein DVH24_003532 [Malus domestica]